MRPLRPFHLLAVVVLAASCHLDRLVNSPTGGSGGGGGGGGSGGGGGGPPPGPPTSLAFTVQPRGTMPDSTIKPPVQVTARDSAGNTVTTFNGTIHVAIATDGSPRKNAKLQGDTVATAVAGVATFSNLSIDTVGTGYTLSAALVTGGAMGTSASFDVAPTPPPPPTTGDLTVGNTTTGSDLDPDGYTVTVDGGQSQPLAVNATTTYTGLSVANHTVQLAGVASNCTVSGANPRTVSVPAGATAQTSFAITCSPLPPTTGDLKVTTSTTGSNLDPDGYTVTVDGTASQAITINNSTGVTFTGLNAGSHSVALSGVAANCTVTGGATQTVTITANQTATLPFSVTCAATTGSLSVTTNTSGSNLDPDGYTVALDGGAGQPIGINTTSTFNGIATGSHTVTLSGVAANCTVGGGTSQTANVASGQTASVSFSVTCAATTGSLTVNTSTSGSNLDPDGYTVAVDGGTGQPIGINASFTFSGIGTGSHTVTLSGVAGNCTVGGGNSQTTTVTGGQTATVAFSVTCTALTGSLTVTTTTSGANQPSGYTVTVDGGQSQTIPASGTASYSGLAATNHSVQLNGVPSNCSVSEANPQTVSVPANGTGQASFTITCTAPTGSLTVSTSTTGSNQPSGYTVTVDGGQSRNINASGTTTYTVTATTHSVQLNGVPSNCSVSEANPQSVTVPANGTGQASFTITCTAPTGSLTVTTSTSGSNQPSGYTVTVDGGQSRNINATGTTTYAVTATTHSVQLNGVPSNCAVSEANPQSVTVPANGTGQASFTITCTAPNQPPSVIAGGDQSVLVGALFALSGASFSDPNHNGPWTITIDWGDGSSDQSTTSSEGSIGGSHSYITALQATYTLTITVTDAGGLSGSASKTVKVTTL